MILTSKRRAEHLFAGRNTQPPLPVLWYNSWMFQNGRAQKGFFIHPSHKSRAHGAYHRYSSIKVGRTAQSVLYAYKKLLKSWGVGRKPVFEIDLWLPLGAKGREIWISSNTTHECSQVLFCRYFFSAMDKSNSEPRKTKYKKKLVFIFVIFFFKNIW